MMAYCVPKDRLQEIPPLSGTLSNMLKITLRAAIEASVKYTERIYTITWYESSRC